MMPTSNVNTSSLIDRIKNILTTPKSEWPVIDAESTDVAKLYSEYIVLLAAIPAIAGFIGNSVIGRTLPFVGTFRIGFVRGLVSAVVTYALTLAGAYVSALVIDKLAPTFNSTSSTIQALKLVAYASTPIWLGGIFNIYLPLAALGLLTALYGVYLFYLGLPVLMKTPQDKVIVYMIVSAVVIVVVMVVVGVIAGAVTGAASVGM
jgi:Yip1 domain